MLREQHLVALYYTAFFRRLQVVENILQYALHFDSFVVE